MLGGGGEGGEEEKHTKQDFDLHTQCNDDVTFGEGNGTKEVGFHDLPIHGQISVHH